MEGLTWRPRRWCSGQGVGGGCVQYIRGSHFPVGPFDPGSPVERIFSPALNISANGGDMFVLCLCLSQWHMFWVLEGNGYKSLQVMRELGDPRFISCGQGPQEWSTCNTTGPLASCHTAEGITAGL